MNETLVTIKHEGIEGTAVVIREAFDLVYQPKGWEIVSDEELAALTPEPPTKIITGDALKAVQDEAIGLGLDPTGTAAEIQDRITAHNEG